jgi:alpha-glucosidase
VTSLPVGPAGSAPPPLASVHHDGSARYVVTPSGGPGVRLGDEVRLRVRAGLDAPVRRILLRTTPDGEQRFTELAEVAPGPASRWWEATLRVAMPATGYRFLVVTEDGHRWLNGSGVHEASPTDRDDFLLLAGFAPPAWLEDRVFYQVFPERFANGDPANDVGDGAWTYRGQVARYRRWDELPGTGPAAMVEFFGGDLAGIEARLDHLVDLGANALYLNPIFASRSNHGYDTIDYERVAHHFGGDAALVALRQATRARDIRLILDIAPNHVGVEHPWFQAAQADATSPTAGYFVFRDHPDDYESWLGVRSLPKLDYRSGALRAAMYEGRDAVLRRWLREPYAIDGWRIDVANMLGRLGPDQLAADVARGMRDAVKAEAPDAYLVGEHWFDALDQLTGDQWDGVMNYAGFRNPLLHWLEGVTYRSHGSSATVRSGRSSTASFLHTLGAFRAAVAWAVARCQFDLVGSHDTARIATVLGGDRGRLRAAFGMLLTEVGVPSIYYGDEVGLAGDDDVHARRPMPWDPADWDREHHGFVRDLVRIRRTTPALLRGGFQVLEAAPDSIAFLRDTDDSLAVAVIVRGPDARPAVAMPVAHGGLPDGLVLTERLTGRTSTVEGGRLDIGATPPGVAIWTGSPG